MKTVDFTQHLLSIQTELFRFAFKLTADREEANDLLQETSLKALDNEEKFTPDTNFKGWMYTIMRNIFINNWHYKIFCVNGKYGIQNRVPYFLFYTFTK